MRDDDGRVHVVAHGLLAARAQPADVDGRGAVGGCELGEPFGGFKESLEALLGGLQGLVAEVHRAAIVCLKDEEADCLRAISLRQQRMATGEELLQGDGVAERLAHLLPVVSDHVVVHPPAHHLFAFGGYGLRDLALVVGEDEVHAAAVDVEMVAEVLAAHRGAFAVPAWEALAPLRWPTHDVLRCGAFPEGEVDGVTLLRLPVQLAGGVEQLVHVAVGEDAVAVVLVVSRHVEVDRAFALVGVAVGQDAVDELHLLDDVSRGLRLDAGREHVQQIHRAVVATRVVLHDLHRLELFDACTLGDLVLALVGVVLEVAHVGDVADVAHLVSEVGEVAEEDVEGDGRTGVAEVRIAVDGGSADIHAHMWRVEGLKLRLPAREGVIQNEFLLLLIHITIHY